MAVTIKGCHILQDGNFIPANVRFDNGVITHIGQVVPPAEEVYDAQGHLLLPGMIDTHVHLREPGLTYKEDFQTGSAAAAAGGITTILDMPNTKPATLTKGDLDYKRLLTRLCIVNWGLHMGYFRVPEHGPFNLDEIAKISTSNSHNIASLKFFTKIQKTETTGKLTITTQKDIREGFEAAQKHRYRITVHGGGPILAKFMEYAEKYHVPVHIAHIASAADVEQLRAYKRKHPHGLVSAEVTPHHLLLTSAALEVLGNYSRMQPPLGTERDRQALWKALRDGTIDSVATDHAPHTREDKKSPEIYGVPGLETALPIILTAALREELPWNRVTDIIARRPAEIYGIVLRGRLEVGYAADMVLCNIQDYTPVEEEKLHTKCKWSPFAGMSFTGWPIRTWVDGNLVFDQGKIYQRSAREVDFKRPNGNAQH